MGFFSGSVHQDLSASASRGEIANKPDLNLVLERQLQYLKQIENQVELQWETYEKGSSYLA